MSRRTGAAIFVRGAGALAIALVRFYQLTVSPLKVFVLGQPSCCRFYPSCSQYAVESIRAHGVLRGSLKASRRLLKCHPFHPGGYDPVAISTCGCRPEDAEVSGNAGRPGNFCKTD